MTTDRFDTPAPEDPVLEARIQHALLHYTHKLTPVALAEARRMLTLVLTTHPVAAHLMDRLRERRAPGVSGVTAKEAEPQPHAHRSGKQGKGPR